MKKIHYNNLLGVLNSTQFEQLREDSEGCISTEEILNKFGVITTLDCLSCKDYKKLCNILHDVLVWVSPLYTTTERKIGYVQAAIGCLDECSRTGEINQKMHNLFYLLTNEIASLRMISLPAAYVAECAATAIYAMHDTTRLSNAVFSARVAYMHAYSMPWYDDSGKAKSLFSKVHDMAYSKVEDIIRQYI
jgi:hypothetical protein